MEKCRDILESGLKDLGLTIESSRIEQLLDFIGLINKWNKAYNLTAIRNKEEMVRLHLLDSLAILPYIEGQRIIDIGTGAGLPGIPLAICLPGIEFTLLDSNAKKTRFVQQAVLELKLNNVHIHHGRVEDYRPDTLFDAVLCRAFASLEDIIKLTGHLLGEGGVLLAMKGHVPDAELKRLSADSSVIPIQVPGTEAKRCLVRLESLKNIEVM
ncbi:MAG: 16S rRNA (guanine(527)-N(7))-methyltransferase RsmG [Gammaproteobacteria bacterium]